MNNLHYITLHYATYTMLRYTTLITLHYATLHYATLHYTNYTTLHYATPTTATATTALHYNRLHYTRLRCSPQHYSTLHYITLHYTRYTTPQLQVQLHYTDYTTHNYNSSCNTPHYIHQLWLQPLQPLQKTQLQPPFGPSVGSLCHPCITTTHLSYSVLPLKLPPPPCAVLLVILCRFHFTDNESCPMSNFSDKHDPTQGSLVCSKQDAHQKPSRSVSQLLLSHHCRCHCLHRRCPSGPQRGTSASPPA